MEEIEYVGCLDADFRILRRVAPTILDRTVPSCPGWTGADLVSHVASVYVDKTETIRTGEEQAWPPAIAEDPLAALDAAYRGLTGEFTARDAAEPAPSWYQGTQTVGWWTRRMAHETVIHRVDAELTAGSEPTPVPSELAIDGIDEVLVCFLAYASTAYSEYLAEDLANSDGATVRIDVPTAGWLVQLGPKEITVERIEPAAEADAEAVLRGGEYEVLLWLWRRSDNSAVELEGNRDVVGKLHRLLGVTTQ